MRCWLAMLSLLASLSCQSAPSDNAGREIACYIIEDFVAEEFNKATKPLFVSQNAPLIFHKQNTGPARKKQSNPLDECPGLASLVAEKGFKPKEYSYPHETKRDGLYDAHDTLAVTLLKISEDGEQATFTASRFCGPQCGGGTLVTYKPSLLGAWMKDDEEPVWAF